LSKNVALHIAATAPLSISAEEIAPALVERERAVLTAKAKEQGKKDEMIPKIIEGQIKKWMAENCLLEQAYVKNPDVKIGDYLKETIAKTGENIVVRRFVRLNSARESRRNMKTSRPKSLPRSRDNQSDLDGNVRWQAAPEQAI